MLMSMSGILGPTAATAMMLFLFCDSTHMGTRTQHTLDALRRLILHFIVLSSNRLRPPSYNRSHDSPAFVGDEL